MIILALFLIIAALAVFFPIQHGEDETLESYIARHSPQTPGDIEVLERQFNLQLNKKFHTYY